ncbi:hypothetical protein GGD56_003476 [Rhizobium mongolense]|uniref:Uncharacterized protein n=1 Tax=Rhizobium mongolense TaxID=57676 RepID=A0ABR6IPK1_9HYPH|nr:hypothetical protein [Rhizobium mongolense]
MAFDILRGRERPSEAQYDRAKLLLHVQTILAFLFGGTWASSSIAPPAACC